MRARACGLALAGCLEARLAGRAWASPARRAATSQWHCYHTRPAAFPTYGSSIRERSRVSAALWATRRESRLLSSCARRSDAARPPSTAPASAPAQQALDSPSTQAHGEARNAKAPAAKAAGHSAESATRLRSALSRLVEMLRQRMTAAQGQESGGSQSEPFPDFRKLWRLASTQRKTLVIALSLLLVSSAISLSVPAAIGRIIDYFGNGASEALFGLSFGKVVAGLVSIFVLGAIARASSNVLLELAGIRIIQSMRRQSFASALRQDVEWVDKAGGDVVSRLSVDTTIVGESLTSDIGDGLRAAVTALAAGGAMAYISTSLTMVMLAVVPPAAVSAVFFGRYIRSLTLKTQDAIGQMTNVANERLSPTAFRTIQAYNAQHRESVRVDQEIQKIADLQGREAKVTSVFYSGTGLIGNCTILLVLSYGGSLVSKGILTVGDLTSFLLYTAYLGGSLTGLTSFFTSIMKGMGAGARVFSLIEREPTIKLGVGKDAPSALPTLQFNQVSFAYPSRPDRKILDKMDLTVRPGSSIALVGPSGIGKTSVHALALRLFDPDAGSISLNGADIRTFKPESLRSIFRVVGQEPVIFEGTIAENIAYSNEEATADEIEAAAAAANCMEFIRALPLGLQTNAKQLSVGQKQRITIARALCGKQRQRILLMDESTSALDSASEFLVNQAIGRIVAEGTNTVWIIAHRLSTIRSVETILVMEEGRIIEQGTFAQLNQPGTRFKELMAAQLQPAKVTKVDSGVAAGTRSYSTSAAAPARFDITQHSDWSVADTLRASGQQNERHASLQHLCSTTMLDEADLQADQLKASLRIIDGVRKQE